MTRNDLATTERRLPELLVRFLTRVGVDPAAAPFDTELVQNGTIRLGPERAWMPFSATQVIRANRPEFVWRARFRMAPGVVGVVVDAYEGGVGRLDARLWGFVPVAHGRGPEIDRGELLRYLAEIPWCPSAIAHDAALHFRQLDRRTVRAWALDEDCYVDWIFDDAGDLVETRTDARTRDGVAEPWRGRFSAYTDFGGLRAPAEAEVWWETATGPFVYWRGQVESIARRPCAPLRTARPEAA